MAKKPLLLDGTQDDPVAQFVAQFMGGQQDQQDNNDSSNDPQSYIDDALAGLSSTTLGSDGSQESDPIPQSGDPVASDSSGLGLSPEDQQAFNWVENKESGGRVDAYNPVNTSTGHAFGRGQLTDTNRKAIARRLGIADPNTKDPAQQDRMTLSYMLDRYGSPTKAKQFWLSHNWY
jgi:hypothetical protein